jgi:hypothetical protein
VIEIVSRERKLTMERNKMGKRSGMLGMGEKMKERPRAGKGKRCIDGIQDDPYGYPVPANFLEREAMHHRR